MYKIKNILVSWGNACVRTAISSETVVVWQQCVLCRTNRTHGIIRFIFLFLQREQPQHSANFQHTSPHSESILLRDIYIYCTMNIYNNMYIIHKYIDNGRTE